MLESGKLAGFLATTDYDKAREFYEGKLGFEFVSLDQYARWSCEWGDTTFASRRFQLHAAATHPLGWEVTDIMAVVSGA